MKIRFPSLAASHSESFSWLLETSDDLCGPLLKAQGLLIKKQTSDPNDWTSCCVWDSDSCYHFFSCGVKIPSHFFKNKKEVSMLMYACAVLYWTWAPRLVQQALHLWSLFLTSNPDRHSIALDSPHPPHPIFSHILSHWVYEEESLWIS